MCYFACEYIVNLGALFAPGFSTGCKVPKNFCTKINKSSNVCHDKNNCSHFSLRKLEN